MRLSLALTTTAFTKKQLLDTPEGKVALAGRSNVGKSSLLNALCGKTLAKTSSTPGKTQSVNYYLLSDCPLYLIDLPGYGYAATAREKKAAWSALTETFFETVTNLQTVFLLLDARHEPQNNDLQMIAYAQEKGFSVTGILTKADKCSRSTIAAHVRIWNTILPCPPLVTSVKTKQGIEEVRNAILEYAGQACVSAPPASD